MRVCITRVSQPRLLHHVHCRMFCSIPGLYPLETSSKLCSQRCLQTLPKALAEQNQPQLRAIDIYIYNVHKKWYCFYTGYYSSVHSLSRVRLFTPHEPQHARPPCPSPTPRVHPDSYPLSPWCHPTISSSVIPFCPALNLSQHQGLFQWVSSSHQVTKILEFQLQHQSFQWTPRTDFL